MIHNHILMQPNLFRCCFSIVLFGLCIFPVSICVKSVSTIHDTQNFADKAYENGPTEWARRIQEMLPTWKTKWNETQKVLLGMDCGRFLFLENSGRAWQ
jgi:hypothetical protein